MRCHKNSLYLPLIYECMNGPLTRKLVILPYIAMKLVQVEIVTFRQKAIEAPSIDKLDKQPILKQIDAKFKI